MNLRHSIRRLGVMGTFAVALEKRKKQSRYSQMLETLKANSEVVEWVGLAQGSSTLPKVTPQEAEHIVSRARSMVSDVNQFFTFAYQTRGIDRPWNFDPIEKNWWPARHYTEKILHAADTPHDVKITWEINRFKDLPTFAQAALLDRNDGQVFAKEVTDRLHSWIKENPVASTINWASGLEIAIRLISWGVTAQMLRRAGEPIESDTEIRKSIWQQAMYLAADLSTDRIVRSNHLIGEAAGLFVTASLWRYRDAPMHRATARAILEKEIIDQTFSDGATREATTWYHKFVTDFFDIAARVAELTGETFSDQYRQRLVRMKFFLAAMQADKGDLARIGDSDDGWALFLEGDSGTWKDWLIGPESRDAVPIATIFRESGYVSLRDEASFLVVRAGEFGMGGDGSSSHAHDDCLSPLLWIDSLPILVDPGTYVYNGMPTERARYRGAEAHNALIIGTNTGAEQRLNFGWNKTRPPAEILEVASNKKSVKLAFGEFKGFHQREIKIASNGCIIVDEFVRPISANGGVTWFLHLHPNWQLRELEGHRAEFLLRGTDDEPSGLLIEFGGALTRVASEEYQYSAGYMIREPAWKLIANADQGVGQFSIRLSFTAGNKQQGMGVTADS